MSRSYWYAGFAALVIAALLGWLLWPPSPNIPKYQEVAKAQTSYYPGGPECQPKNLASLRRIKERLTKASECEEKAEAYRQQQDANLQSLRSANGAEQGTFLAFSQAKAGVVQAILSVLGVAFTGWAALEAAKAAQAAQSSVEESRLAAADDDRRHAEQLALAKESAAADLEEAKRATAAALDAAKYARETLHNDRAWMVNVAIEASFFSGALFDVPVTNGIQFKLRWGNVGRSPAFKVIIHTFYLPEPIQQNPFTDGIIAGYLRTEDTVFIASGHSVTADNYAVNEMTGQQILRGERFIYIYSIALYRDIFEPEKLRKTILSMRVEGAGVTQDGNHPIVNGAPFGEWIIE